MRWSLGEILLYYKVVTRQEKVRDGSLFSRSAKCHEIIYICQRKLQILFYRIHEHRNASDYVSAAVIQGATKVLKALNIFRFYKDLILDIFLNLRF